MIPEKSHQELSEQCLFGAGSSCGLEEELLHLIRFRVSQINGCAYCLDMHSKDLRAAGETEQRLYLLDTWRESPFYSERERAALEWAKAVTPVANAHVPDEVYKSVRRQFTEAELANLTLVVAAINCVIMLILRRSSSPC